MVSSISRRATALSNDVIFTDESPSSTKQITLKINCDSVDPDEISEFLFELGVSSVSVEVEKERSDLVASETVWKDLVKVDAWKTAILKANIPRSFDYSQLLEILRSVYPSELFSEVIISDLLDKDWVLSVQQLWRPLKVSKQMTVLFPWHQNEVVDSSYSLQLEGGVAFGTGDHPTTRLCCQWLEEQLLSPPVLPARTVLDYGCGSGILGLAALKFGATDSTGTDIDRDSLVAARENAVRNNHSMKFYLVDDIINQSNEANPDIHDQQYALIRNSSKGRAAGADFPSIKDLEGKEFDIVVANILAPILMTLAPVLARHSRKNIGQLALSGVLASQANRVIEIYRQYFEEVTLRSKEDDWVLITCKQRR